MVSSECPHLCMELWIAIFMQLLRENRAAVRVFLQAPADAYTYPQWIDTSQPQIKLLLPPTYNTLR
jgi:hypothetical protein